MLSLRSSMSTIVRASSKATDCILSHVEVMHRDELQEKEVVVQQQYISKAELSDQETRLSTHGRRHYDQGVWSAGGEDQARKSCTLCIFYLFVSIFQFFNLVPGLWAAKCILSRFFSRFQEWMRWGGKLAKALADCICKMEGRDRQGRVYA